MQKILNTCIQKRKDNKNMGRTIYFTKVFQKCFFCVENSLFAPSKIRFGYKIKFSPVKIWPEIVRYYAHQKTIRMKNENLRSRPYQLNTAMNPNQKDPADGFEFGMF